MTSLRQAFRHLDRRHKYQAKAQTLDGYQFPSKAERDKYAELKLLERAGRIRDLEVHPKFPLVVNGNPICTYIADFRFFDVDRGTVRTLDVKGARTALFILKKKLVFAIHGIEVEEIKA